MVVFVVLNECAGLFEIVTGEVVAEVFDLFLDNWNTITPYDYSFHFNRADLIIPVVVPHITYLKPFVRISL